MAPRTLALLAASLLVVGGAACSPTSETSTGETPAPTTTVEAPATAPASAAPQPEGEDAETRNAAALQAIATAADAAGGTPYEIDDSDDDDAWDVDVMVGERTHEVTVSADGLTVLDQKDEDADVDDHQRLGRAGLGLGQAIEAALREIPGSLDGVELEEENGTAVWKVQIDTPDAEDVIVVVNIQDGSILH